MWASPVDQLAEKCKPSSLPGPLQTHSQPARLEVCGVLTFSNRNSSFRQFIRLAAIETISTLERAINYKTIRKDTVTGRNHLIRDEEF